MSLVPYFDDEPYYGHHSGLGVDPSVLWANPYHRYHRSASQPLRPWTGNTLFRQQDGAERKSHIGKDGFQVCLDVQHFQQNEITVKTVGNTVVVEAHHEERPDEHGFIARNFKRRYDLPEGFNAAEVVSTLSSDGILSIKAPHAGTAPEGNVRQIQIQQTGPAHLPVGNKQQPEQITDKK